MKPIQKTAPTPIGNIPAPMSPRFEKDLEKCETNEDLFEIVEDNGFINPDAFNEVCARGLYIDYQQWKKKKFPERYEKENDIGDLIDKIVEECEKKEE